MKPLFIGIIGCGNISHSYLKGAARSKLIRVQGIADQFPEAARARSTEYGVPTVSVDELLADPAIEIVLNLTVPVAHAAVSRQIIAAGKHVYSEKPLGITYAEAIGLREAALTRGVRIGCAPDTFLGAGHQACRRALDAGRIGQPIAGTAFFATHGMEHWHPNPAFFYQAGGGPVLDIGPYYVTQLINLLGPITRVTAQASRASTTRLVSSEPRRGTAIEVQVPTTATALLTFAEGANITLTTSWDIWKHCHLPFEIYGSEGTMLVPDPNFFGGQPVVSERDGAWQELDLSPHPFGAPNRTLQSGEQVADYRIIGLLDLAAALRQERPHRAGEELATHVLEVLDAFERSSLEGRTFRLETHCERPAALPLGQDEEVFLQ